jgi:hypothetical protein
MQGIIKEVCFGKYSALVVETAITVFHSNTTNLGCLLDLVTEETLVESWFCLHIPPYQGSDSAHPTIIHSCLSYLSAYRLTKPPRQALRPHIPDQQPQPSQTPHPDSFTAYQDRLCLPQRRHHVDQVRPPHLPVPCTIQPSHTPTLPALLLTATTESAPSQARKSNSTSSPTTRYGSPRVPSCLTVSKHPRLLSRLVSLTT